MYLTLNKSGKNGPMRLRRDFRAGVSLSKTVSTASQANKLQISFLQNNTGDGILLQALRGGTSLNGLGSELIKKLSDIFCYSWFRLQLIAIHCNRRGVWTDTPHTSFFSRTSHLIIDVHTQCMAQVSVCARHSVFMPSMMSV